MSKTMPTASGATCPDCGGEREPVTYAYHDVYRTHAPNECIRTLREQIADLSIDVELLLSERRRTP